MAISLTKDQLTFRAWMGANPSSDEKDLLLPHVQSMIDRAVGRLTDQMKEKMDVRLQKEFSGTLAANADVPPLGEAVLDDTVMPDTLRDSWMGHVIHSDFNRPLVMVKNLSDLYYPHFDATLGYYFITGGNASGGKIFAVRSDSSPLTGAIRYRAFYYPAFAQLPAQYEDDLIETLVELTREKLSEIRRRRQMGG